MLNVFNLCTVSPQIATKSDEAAGGKTREISRGWSPRALGLGLPCMGNHQKQWSSQNRLESNFANWSLYKEIYGKLSKALFKAISRDRNALWNYILGNQISRGLQEDKKALGKSERPVTRTWGTGESLSQRRNGIQCSLAFRVCNIEGNGSTGHRYQVRDKYRDSVMSVTKSKGP